MSQEGCQTDEPRRLSNRWTKKAIKQMNQEGNYADESRLNRWTKKAVKRMSQEGSQTDEPRRLSNRWTKKATKQMSQEGIQDAKKATNSEKMAKIKQSVCTMDSEQCYLNIRVFLTLVLELFTNASIAQLVEHEICHLRVTSSRPALGTGRNGSTIHSEAKWLPGIWT